MCKTLIQHYERQLTAMDSYWNKFNISEHIKLNTFQLEDVNIIDECNMLQTNFTSFDHILSMDNPSRSLKVTGYAGYGKSAFINEIVRQWTKGEKAWTKKIHFLYLFRPIAYEKAGSLKSFLTKNFDNENRFC